MNKLIVGVIALLLSFSFSAQGATVPNNVTTHDLKELVKLTGVRDIQLSPDGQHLSVVFRENAQEKLAIVATASKKARSVFHVRGARRSVGEVNWINSQRLVYSVQESYSNDKYLRDTGEFFGANVDGSKHNILVGVQAFKRATTSRIKQDKPKKGRYKIVDLLSGDDEHILVAFYPWILKGKFYRQNPRSIPSVYKLNVYTGRKKLVTKLSTPQATAMTDSNAQVRFSMGLSDDNHSVISYRKKQSDPWQRFSIPNFSATHIQPLAFTPNNKSVFVSAVVNGTTAAIFRVNLDDFSYVKMSHDPIVSPSRYISNYQNKGIIIVAKDRALPSYDYLKPNDKKSILHQTLVSSFPGHDIRITSSTDDGSLSTVFVFSDQNSGDFYLFNSQENSAQHLFTASAWLVPELMAKMSPITIKARDNTQIHGYLTLPTSGSKDLPMVVLPHGGPHGIRDRWGYDWEVQVLANSGYAVLQVNFRGSGGYGVEFEHAGYRQWGALMQDDITDATRAMVDNGVADKNKICIYGASYGAYAAIMGAAREPELYKCAIGSMGVYDLPMMFKAGDITKRKSGMAYLTKALGSDIEDLMRRSPVHNVKSIQANLLLIHGEKDERAPIEQAQALKKALEAIGKPYQWLALRDEAHGYYDEKNRLLVYEKILSFLNKNIGTECCKK